MEPLTNGQIALRAVIVGLIVTFAVITGFAYTTLLERKLLARLQARIGPNRAGYLPIPRKGKGELRLLGGIMQPAADAVKLFFKEDPTPAQADKWVYFIAPMLTVMPAILILAVIPFATEVRTLAQRSAAAAKEIKSLIGDSVNKVENGTQLVDQAGKTMDEIVISVKRVTDIMAEISAASEEQSVGIEKVNLAIAQMDEMTQQNTALVEEGAAASESMHELANELTKLVAVFRTNSSISLIAEAGTVSEHVERRGPHRATNVQRLPLSAKLATNSIEDTVAAI